MAVDQEPQGRQPSRILAQRGARPADDLVGVVGLQRHHALDQVGAAMAVCPLEHRVGIDHRSRLIPGGEPQLGQARARLVAGVALGVGLDDRLERRLGLGRASAPGCRDRPAAASAARRRASARSAA